VIFQIWQKHMDNYMDQKRIIIFGGEHETTRLVYHVLAEEFDVALAIIEQPVSRNTVLKRRLKKLGFLSVLGQALFVALVMPFLRLEAKSRVHRLQNEENTFSPIPPNNVQQVASINDDEVLEAVKTLKPTHIVVNGTRLIAKRFLDKVDVPIINIHVGWNPRYKGGNGGYWALAENDPEHCGVTVHMIDEGIDTGGVLARCVIAPTKDDNFITYPLLQVIAGVYALRYILRTNNLQTIDTSGEPSGMWYHPTLWGYIWRRIWCGVK